MLGLPVLSAKAGFAPSLAMFFLCWLFMLATGLLLLEANLWFKEGASLLTIADRTLGRPGRSIAWVVYLFLFYSLLVAYIAASGSLIAPFFNAGLGLDLSQGTGAVLFSLFSGLLIFLGIGAVDWFNRFLMLALIASYLCLIAMGLPYVQLDLVKRSNWEASFLVVPVAIISFGYHNLIPSLTAYFKGHAASLKKVIFFGSAIPLVVYVLWEWVILGLTPLIEFHEALDQGEIATQALKDAVGSAWIGDVAQIFAFFAILTSFLSVAISFVDFLADGLSIPKKGSGKAILAFLTLGPPLMFALYDPTVFLSALNYAGGYGTVVLFGILPALMVWQGRYRMGLKGPLLLPGGKFTLLAILLVSAGVMVLQFTTG
jgi:tyrosine-specific transport protein